MFVGEIGFPRKEFLHDLKWWEVKSIIRGYNARHHAGWEQARLIAYNAHYCMGLPEGKTAPNVNDWIRFSWEKSLLPTFDEVADVVAEINAINAQRQQQTTPAGSSTVQSKSSEE